MGAGDLMRSLDSITEVTTLHLNWLQTQGVCIAPPNNATFCFCEAVNYTSQKWPVPHQKAAMGSNLSSW